MSLYEDNIEMPEALQKLYGGLIEQLDRSCVEHENTILICQNSIKTIKNAVDLLKKYLFTNPFKNSEEEIIFFKFIKPKFYAQFVYYNKIFKIELRRPIGSYLTEKDYLINELDKLSLFFKTNSNFYEYYRSGATFMDKHYFLRTSNEINVILDSTCLDADPNFTTSHDYKVAKILANDRLQIYLNRAIDKQDSKKTGFTNQLALNPLKWTDSKTGLIELSYALKYAGSFNNGQADVKQISEYFEKVFDVELGNTSKAFQEILSRKSGYTNFLRKLDSKLVQYIESII
jgi:RteC protein